MKKIIFTILFLLGITTAHAQIAGTEMFYNNPSERSANNTSYKKNCFGLDLGIGGVKDIDGATADIGIRYLHNFSPYIGWDVFNAKSIWFIKNLTDGADISSAVVPQLMTGIRGYTPTFAGNMSVYGAFKMGCGYAIDMEAFGFCYEFEIGLHLTHTIFIAYAFNHQGGHYETAITNSKGKIIGYRDTDIKQNYSAFRVGFNF